MSYSKIERKTLQLNEFISKYFDCDDSKLVVCYNHDSDVFFVELSVRSELSVYNLVTQKNSLRSFSSMNSLFNALPLSSGEFVELTFESAAK